MAGGVLCQRKASRLISISISGGLNHCIGKNMNKILATLISITILTGCTTVNVYSEQPSDVVIIQKNKVRDSNNPYYRYNERMSK